MTASIAFQKDFLRWMLSDGAGAALVEPVPQRSMGLSLRIDWIAGRSYANEQPACMYAGAEKLADGRLKSWRDLRPEGLGQNAPSSPLRQDVKQLNEHVMPYTVERPLREIPQLKALKPADIDFFVPHYSSHYFRDKVYAHVC